MRLLHLLPILALSGCFEREPPPGPVVDATPAVKVTGKVVAWCDMKMVSPNTYRGMESVATGEIEGCLLKRGAAVLPRMGKGPGEGVRHALTEAKALGAGHLLEVRIDRFIVTNKSTTFAARQDGLGGNLYTQHNSYSTDYTSLALGISATLYDLQSGMVVGSASTAGTYMGDAQASLATNVRAVVNAMVAP
jgi:hypothetical protein